MRLQRVPAKRGSWVAGAKAGRRYGVCRKCLATIQQGDLIREAPRQRRIFQHVSCPKAVGG